MNSKKSLFTERVVNHWNRLPNEMVVAPRLPEFMQYLDCVEPELDSVIFVGPFQLEISYDSKGPFTAVCFSIAAAFFCKGQKAFHFFFLNGRIIVHADRKIEKKLL